VVAVVALVTPLGGPLLAAGLALQEIVGRIVGESTELLVAVYVLLVVVAIPLDVRGPPSAASPPAPVALRVLGAVLGLLALLGIGFTVALALRAAPLPSVFVSGGAGLGWIWGRRQRARRAAAPAAASSVLPPTLSLFVFVHVLVEAMAGHLANRPVQGLLGWLAGLSWDAPVLHALVFGLAAAALLALGTARGHRGLPLSAAGGVLTVVLLLVPGPLPLAAFAVAVVFGVSLGGAGGNLVDWARPDPHDWAAAWGPAGLVALIVLGGHYAETMVACDDRPAVQYLSHDAGAFALETTPDGRTLVASLREAQELLIFDLASPDAPPRRVSLASDEDSLFDRAEPETLLALDDRRVLVLVARSDGEDGNALRVLDVDSGRLGPALPALGAGVADITRDGTGGVWLGAEFEGRIARVDIAAGTELARFELPDVETNRVLVHEDRAWVAGLWWDDQLRLIDLGTGDELASTAIGTHQWDLARADGTIWVPRFLAGTVEGYDEATLEPVDAYTVGFGVRPIEVLGIGAIATGGYYDGRVTVRYPDAAVPPGSHHLGGQIKALHARGDQLYAAGNCGIARIGARRP